MYLSKRNITYPAIYYRTPIFLLTAHYLVAYGEPESFFTLLQLPYYYYAVLGSFIITMATAEFILVVTRYLDKVKPWGAHFRRRLWLQLVLGVLVTLLLAILLAAAYFYIRGQNIITADYFKYDFTLVVCFVLFLNLIYLIIAQMQGRQQLAKLRLPSKHKPTEVNQTKTEVAAIYPLGQGYLAVLKNGESVIWSKTIEQSLSELPADQYFLINRSDIVNRAIIEGFELGHSRRLKLILKITLPHNRSLIVSQRKVVAFKR
ncbi:hypothetical protein DBR40_11705 [Pedobacter sp. KBW01]|uniref:LytTR family transcriptional regulator DNA-binding domain-containing protein n=1 Tax=Pedobacter sp. KBW01 TaxID=2153364 RepID=UPI000F593C71|nr:LytTR family transcriptional regulator DNA-binding domain-containing protein [Pedobacter sp. KBW01]RQO76559.1 hypothetical protein DBR40_11705 [Pedobacter sp. KBW01]